MGLAQVWCIHGSRLPMSRARAAWPAHGRECCSLLRFPRSSWPLGSRGRGVSFCACPFLA